jgi:hypothetical protein
MDVSLVIPPGNGNIGCSQNMYDIERISQYTSTRLYCFQKASYCELQCSKTVLKWSSVAEGKKDKEERRT